MRTIAEIQTTPGGDLYVDLVLDPAALVIRRLDGGLVRVGLGELGDLTDVLLLAALELRALANEVRENEQPKTNED